MEPSLRDAMALQIIAQPCIPGRPTCAEDDVEQWTDRVPLQVLTSAQFSTDNLPQ